MNIYKVLSIFWALVLVCVSAFAREVTTDKGIIVDISWSSLGIPHIQAGDRRSLGYGIGYAYAMDNACLLLDEILTVRGERSAFHGGDGVSSARLDNIHSDFYFRWLNGEEAVERFWRAQPEPIQQLLSGYTAGFNRYMRESTSGATPACRNEPWFRPIEPKDLVRLLRRLLVEGGIGQFAEAVVTTTPPGAGKARLSRTAGLAGVHEFSTLRGSNAIAVGGSKTENGKGRLLANPHFPWFGAHRFYQLHLTIPGVLDVMGAALPGMPLVNIGFNRNLAWTHTVDQASHFTLHKLRLDPNDVRRYYVDGKAHSLQTTTVSIKVREPDGKHSVRTHDIYESRFGPVIALEGELDWTGSQAYALQDANSSNTRALSQWHAMNSAGSLAAFRRAVLTIHGIPWTNTLAVDDRGQALYMDVTVVPNIPAERLAECADPAAMNLGLPGLDGSRGVCDWQSDEGAAQTGIVASARLPILQREDFVQNANDSAWMSNPAAPLRGYSPLVSREAVPLGLRARFALEQLSERKDSVWSEPFLMQLVTGNHVYLADLVIEDLLAFCQTLVDGDARRSCDAMSAWGRTANLDAGPGYLYFEAFAKEFLSRGDAWRIPFDAADPLHTPRGLAWKNPASAERLTAMLDASTKRVNLSKESSRLEWGQLQGATRGASFIPIPGGDGALGIYNAIQSTPTGDGRREVVAGSSYIQLVSFDEQGPVAKGVLTFSQASEPSSPHARDQTELFSQQQWRLLPFTAEQLHTDPPVRRLQLRE